MVIRYLGALVFVFFAVLLALFTGFISPMEGVLLMGLVNIILFGLAVWRHFRQLPK
jgi:hypothetical protein